MTTGILIVKPVSAKLKRDTDTFGKMDPYCKVTVGYDTQKSKTHHSGGKFPTWKDTLTFKKNDEDFMRVQVWDKDTTSDDMVGECTIPLSDILDKKKVSDWYTLAYKGKMAGEVLLEIEFKPEEFKNNSSNNYYGNTTSMMMGQQPFNPVYGMVYNLPMQYMQQQQTSNYISTQGLGYSMMNQMNPNLMQQQQPIYQQQQVYQQPTYQQQQVYVQPTNQQQQQVYIQTNNNQQQQQQQVYIQPNNNQQQQQQQIYIQTTNNNQQQQQQQQQPYVQPTVQQTVYIQPTNQGYMQQGGYQGY